MGINMAAVKGNIAVLYGGESSEREVSLKSGNAVLAALHRMGVGAVAIDAGFGQIAGQLQENQIRHCVNMLHGGAGENGHMQALLESLGISYTGSGVLGCAIAMDKQRTKLLWKGAGVKTADFVSIDDETGWRETQEKLGGKVMIKPANEGSSIGMAIVDSQQGFDEAVRIARQYDADVIAEKWLSGPEYTVSILGDRALPVIRLETNNSFYDYQAKYLSDETQYICPCGLPESEEKSMQNEALRAFRLLGCAGWGRVDVMQDEDGEFYLLEANTVPGMTDHSLVPMAAEAAGINFDELVSEIVNLSLL